MARKKIAVKKKVVRKKAPKGQGAPAGAAAGGSPGKPGRPPKAPKEKLPGEGVSVGGIIMMILAVAMIAGVIGVFVPRDISYVGGYPYTASDAPSPPRNLLREIEDKLVERKGNLTFTEADLNMYLNQRLKSKQGGAFASFVEMQGAYIDYEPSEITIHIERKVFGIPFIVSARFDVYQSNNQFNTEIDQCRLGLVKLPKGKMFRPIMAPFSRLGNSCERELKILTDEDVKFVKIEKDQVVIDFNL